MTPEDDPAYQATDATQVLEEIFGAGLTPAEAIEKLRARLLDLRARKGIIESGLAR
jgi:hypothetical protein